MFTPWLYEVSFSLISLSQAVLGARKLMMKRGPVYPRSWFVLIPDVFSCLMHIGMARTPCHIFSGNYHDILVQDRKILGPSLEDLRYQWYFWILSWQGAIVPCQWNRQNLCQHGTIIEQPVA